MTTARFSAMVLVSVMCMAPGCSRKTPPIPETAPPHSSPSPRAPMAFTGRVVAATNASRYTYVQVEADGTSVWAAATAFDVKVGDTVTVPTSMPMQNFTSDALHRTFDTIYFASAITVNGAQSGAAQLPPNHPQLPAAHPAMSGAHPAMMPGHGHAAAAGTTNSLDFSGITKPEGGKTVAEIYAEKNGLAGKKVLLRARVTKVNANIMGKNWVHLQDGTGSDGSNELTAVTTNVTGVGETVTVGGILATNRDFGMGLKYALVIDKAEIQSE